MAEDYSAKSAREMHKQLRLTAGSYVAHAMTQREQYVRLRLRQDLQVRKIYNRAADRVSADIRAIAKRNPGTMTERYLSSLEKSLRLASGDIKDGLTDHLVRTLPEAAEIGSSYSLKVTTDNLSFSKLKSLPINRHIVEVNEEAVESAWARTSHGMKLSDRIWQKAENARETMAQIIQDAIATGEDPIKTAQKIDRYVNKGARTLAVDYPEVLQRLGRRLPSDLSYEALRLVQTETAAVYGQAKIKAARASPSYMGMRWLLNTAHQTRDVCDELADADHGLGRGVYPPGEEPFMPAHPSCQCQLIEVHENPEDFRRRLREWTENPASHPDLDAWYKEEYQPYAGNARSSANDDDSGADPSPGGNGVSPVPSDIIVPQSIRKRAAEKFETDQDAIEVGDLIRQEVDRVQAPIFKRVQDLEAEIRARNKDLASRVASSEEMAEYQQRYDELTAARQDQRLSRGEIIRDTLAAIRPMGNPASQSWVPYSEQAVKDAIADVGRYFPSDWWKLSNPAKIIGLLTSERGYYNPTKPAASIALPPTGIRRLAIHELGHRFEHLVPGLLDLQKQFYERRTAGELLLQLGKPYDSNELARFDQFIDPYMGKDYGGKSYEIFSMGLEAMFAGSYDLANDPEYEAFILGVLSWR